MSMTLFCIDDAIRSRIEQVVEYASRLENYYFANRSKVPGDMPEHVVEIAGITPGTFRCVFSRTASQGSIYRHLSMSIWVGHRKLLPHPEFALELGKLFGFELEKGFATEGLMVTEQDSVIVFVKKIEGEA